MRKRGSIMCIAKDTRSAKSPTQAPKVGLWPISSPAPDDDVLCCHRTNVVFEDT